MSKTPNYDAKVKMILDVTQPGERVCALTGEKWMMDEEEIGWYKKFNVPPSKVSPQIRMLVTASHGSIFQWWYQKHPETGRPLITCIHPASGIKVLPDKEWVEKDFAEVNFPFSTDGSFFERMYKLERSIPVMATRNRQEPKNSISVMSVADENDILTFWCKAKNSLYSIALFDGERCAEALFAEQATNCYNILHSNRMFDCSFTRYAQDCLHSSFLFDCWNCTDCYGAVNRRNAKFLFWNEQLSEGEYRKRREGVDLSCRSSRDREWETFQQLMQQAIWPENFNIQTEASVGEHLKKCHDCRYCFACSGGPAHLYWVNYGFGHSEYCAFVDGADNSSSCYYCVGAIESQSCKFSHTSFHSRELEYCLHCRECEDCFGCVGLTRKRFHIFNKEYSGDVYWRLVDELKCAMLERGEYGEFFPSSHAPSQFLESMEATMVGLCTKEMAQALGANMFETGAEGAIGDVAGQESVSPNDIPDCIGAVDDSWTKKPILDPEIGRRFALFKPEIAYYKAFRLSPPKRHFITRIRSLLEEANVGRYEESACQACQKQITVAVNTAYPNRMIYCKPCYLQYLEKHG